MDTEGGAGAQGAGARHENGISSVKYYSLTDDNVRKFYDEWRFKTMAIIRKKGWESPFAYDKTLPIPTRDEVEVDATANAKEKDVSIDESNYFVCCLKYSSYVAPGFVSISIQWSKTPVGVIDENSSSTT